MVQGLWYHQISSIIDVKLGDADTDMYKYEPMSALLSWWEMIKNTSTGSTVTTNRNIFRRFFSQWTRC